MLCHIVQNSYVDLRAFLDLPDLFLVFDDLMAGYENPFALVQLQLLVKRRMAFFIFLIAFSFAS